MKARSPYVTEPGEPRLPDWDALPLPDLGSKRHVGQWGVGREAGRAPRGGLRARGRKNFIGLLSGPLSLSIQNAGTLETKNNVFSHVIPGPAFTACKCMQILCKRSLWLGSKKPKAWCREGAV